MSNALAVTTRVQPLSSTERSKMLAELLKGNFGYRFFKVVKTRPEKRRLMKVACHGPPCAPTLQQNNNMFKLTTKYDPSPGTHLSHP